MNCYLLPVHRRDVRQLIERYTKAEIADWCLDRGYQFIRLNRSLYRGGDDLFEDYPDQFVFPTEEHAFEFVMRWL